MIAWFLCPYDVEDDLNGRVCLVSAVARYLPTSPGPDGAEWTAVDIQKGYTVVKVSASAKLLDTIRADPDFHDITSRIAPEAMTVLAELGYKDLLGTKENIVDAILATRSPIVGVVDGTVVYGEPVASDATAVKLDAQIAGAAGP